MYSERFDKYHKDTLQIQERIDAIRTLEKTNFRNLYPVEAHLSHLETLILKSKERGIHLIYILPPRLTLDDYKEVYPVFNYIPDRHKIGPPKYEALKEIYMTEYSFDIGHLNEAGALKYTNYLAKRINEILN